MKYLLIIEDKTHQGLKIVFRQEFLYKSLDLFLYTQEILNAKLHFLNSVS